jgi:hypothetical protein
MIKVNILKNWDFPDLLQQTPGNTGRWGEIEFSINAEQPADYVIVLNHPRQDTWAVCPPQHVWAVIQEPPAEFNKLMHRGDPSYARVYTTDEQLTRKRFIHSHPALPWHINRSYDFLKRVDVPQKTGDISWVTSNLANIQGHRDRMVFLEQIRGKLEFDLFGRGFKQVDDKWQAVAPYRYTIAVENYSNPYYWSEKIADCFLGWSMPIYYGCTRITDYFPAEAMLLIDIHRPEEALERIREGVQAERWQRNLEAIRFAREQVLERHQLFPFVAGQIKQERKPLFFRQKAHRVFIPAEPRTPRFFAERIKDLAGLSLDLAKKVYHRTRKLPGAALNLAQRALRKIKSLL